MNRKDEDILLLERYARTGDAEAFSQLVGRYQDFVYSACLRVLGNAADAEDAAQECFLRLVRKSGTVSSSLAGWLHSRATALSIDERRRRAARKRREEVHGQMNSANNSDPTWQEIAPHIDEALEQLPDGLRVVLVEHFLRRRKQADIARQLGVSASTVSRRVDSGIEELRKKLKKAGVMVSAAVLASLVSENAVQAAPASLTAALGKMAVAAAARGGGAAATGAASWVAKGTVAGSMTAAAKAKLIAVAVVATLAVGGVVVHKVMDKPEESAAGNPQQPPAKAEERPPKEQPPAKPALLSLLPRNALGWIWISDLGELKAKLTRLLGFPLPIDEEVRALVTGLGFPEEAMHAPMAVVTMAPADPSYMTSRDVILFVTIDDVDTLTKSLGRPGADGIYSASTGGLQRSSAPGAASRRWWPG